MCDGLSLTCNVGICLGFQQIYLDLKRNYQQRGVSAAYFYTYETDLLDYAKQDRSDKAGLHHCCTDGITSFSDTPKGVAIP
jgi:hypothetical protein